MTSSCAALLDYLFGELELHRVTIQCGTGNRRSCAIPERLGFTREGMLREAEVAEGRELPVLVARMFADADVAYIHAHNARPGCYSCRIDRAAS